MNSVSALSRPVGAASLRQLLASWRERRVARLRIEGELNAHTDRQLAELGLSRSDIPTVAAGRYRAP